MSERRGEYGRRIDDHQLDLSLLLYIRGATAREAAESTGLTEAQWRRRVSRLGQGWVDAKRARWLRPHGTESRYHNGGCRCSDCTRASREASYVRAGVEPTTAWSTATDKQQVDAWRRRAEYAESLDTAERHRRAWTGPELELAARDDLSIAEIAKLLGRTTHSVVNMRRKLRHEPKYRALAGSGGLAPISPPERGAVPPLGGR